MIDLQERFDRAWTGEPEHRHVEERLAGGRARLRRRRLALAGGTLAAVVALAGAASVAGPDLAPGPSGGGAPVAGGPTPADADVPSGARGVDVARGADLDRLGDDDNAAYTVDGRLVVRPGWLVTQKVDDVYVGPDARSAVGLEVRSKATSEGEWYYLSWFADGTSAVNLSSPQANLGMTLRDWLPRPDGTRSRP